MLMINKITISCSYFKCKKEFYPKNDQQIYCSKKCRDARRNRKRAELERKGYNLYTILANKYPDILVKLEKMMKKEKGA